MLLKEIDAKGTLQGFVFVRSCDRKTAKNGSVYLDLMINDSEQDVAAKIWDFKGSAEEQPIVNSVILVRGVLNLYNNQPQFRIDRFRQANDNDEVDIGKYIPSASFPGIKMYDELLWIVDHFRDEQLKKITSAVLEEYKNRIIELPAAFRLHHAVRGGLMMHTLSICRLAQRVAELYPSVDGDLLLAGAILHDVAKSDEFNLSPTGLVDSYTVSGILVGHLVKGAIIIEEIGRRLGIDEELITLLEHMLISHHGEPEFGAAVRPSFLEAEILSALDTLDANIYEIESVVKGVQPGGFSVKVWALNDRKFYNHGRKAPVTDVAFRFSADTETDN